MSAPNSSHWDLEVRLLACLALCVSVLSFLFYFRRGEALLYGDAVAHINIARRVFDSRTPGLLQLGTVWLPLPHLLMIPFLISDRMWQSGLGGSIPSMVAYVFGVVGTFRLVRTAIPHLDPPVAGARVAAWGAAAIYAANPNLIYMQATAMGEAAYMAFFIWSVVYLAEFLRGENPALTKCGLCLAAACLTRYDGWFLAAVMVMGVVVSHLRRETGDQDGPPGSAPPRRTPLVRFALIALSAPALWLAYNAAVYRNPLEFATGQYSARAIESKTGTINPAKNNLYAAGSYFLKASELNVAEAAWQGRLWLALAAAGSLVAWFRASGRTVLLLWLPLPFYALSIAYGSVPIFVPAWWPFTYYNVRYGLQLLPVFAVFVALAISSVVGMVAKFAGPESARGHAWSRAAAVLVFFLLADSYLAIWRNGPICYQEAAINMRGRIALERQLANWLKDLPPNSTLLMYLGGHPGAVQQAGIPLKRVINEGNHRVWMQPDDPEGPWERALANPSEFADYVVAFEGDPVWNAVRSRHLPELVEINMRGQQRAILYRAR